MNHWTDKLVEISACSDAVEWCKQFDTIEIAWQHCERSDWMLWLLRKCKIAETDKTKFVRLAIRFAESSLHFYEDKYPNNKKPREAIEAAKKWVDNPTEENRVAANAAAYAAYAAYAEAYAAAYVATNADFAANAAAYAATNAANAAAYAAYAAYAAAYAANAATNAAYAAAYTLELKSQCNWIRELFPNPPTME